MSCLHEYARPAPDTADLTDCEYCPDCRKTFGRPSKIICHSCNQPIKTQAHKLVDDTIDHYRLLMGFYCTPCAKSLEDEEANYGVYIYRTHNIAKKE